MRGADLRGANFCDATLVNANLRSADLRGADLTDANLTDANLVGVKWSVGTLWPRGLVEDLLARSEPLGGGGYVVQGSGNSGADLSIPPVPVP
ncbi:pentapeptide repeat-containing protein [Kitasatospora sp. NPDC057015]|uniref:pentapeptide repeat-containing protein n=1 Tax=Kitasatospora sp. NPDC057015 TaxID=3346001 RepID=UPI0036266CBD